MGLLGEGGSPGDGPQLESDACAPRRVTPAAPCPFRVRVPVQTTCLLSKQAALLRAPKLWCTRSERRFPCSGPLWGRVCHSRACGSSRAGLRLARGRLCSRSHS